MNLQQALKKLEVTDMDNAFLARKAWLDSGSNLRLLPSLRTLVGLTNESFFADDWMVVEDK